MPFSPFVRAAVALAIASSPLSGCAAYVGEDDPGVEATSQALGTSGVLDPSFGQGGKVTTPFDLGGAPAGALQTDGKIVVAATVQDLVIGNPAIFGLARYLSNGTLDTAFGNRGLVRTYFGDKAASVRAIAIAPDGKILLVGNVSYQTVSPTGAVAQVEALALARYTTTGALDTTFGQGGQTIVSLLGKTDRANAVLLQPDSKILVGGSARVLTGGYSAPTATAIARFLPSGAFDTSFGQGGKVTTVLFGAVDSLALEANGNILAANGHKAARFSPSGAALSLPASTTLTAVSAPAFTNNTFQPDSKILFGSSVRGMNKRTNIIQMQRYLLDGVTLDSSFVSPPFSYAPQVSNTSTSVQAIALLPSGKFIVAGSARLPLNSPGVSTFGLASVQANGALDANFGNGGTLTTQFTGRDQASALLVQPDGKLIALGMSGDANGEHYAFSLARYTL